MTTPDTLGGRFTLTIAHVVGMIDMVALPIWVGTLMQYNHFRPAQAGFVVTLFLLGALTTSILCAPLFNRLPRRWAAAGGFGISAASFALAAHYSIASNSFAMIAAFHIFAGFGVGTALSLTDGSIGRSANPHRLFGIVNVMLGLSALLFLGIVSKWVASGGSPVLFTVFAIMMACAATAVLLAFPTVLPRDDDAKQLRLERIPPAVWLLVGVVICITLTQAMVFSFMERVGISKGFTAQQVHLVLVSLGFANLLPGFLAAALQRRINPLAVGMIGPLAQATLAVILSQSTSFWPYAVASVIFVPVLIFTHTFLFGLITRLDTTGRTAAATPAMTMAGACIGPAFGGVIVQAIGYTGLGMAACLLSFVAIVLMVLVRHNIRNKTAQLVRVQV
ncbi:MFS transporter [Robbsia andropogonis]|uniref:MFS transporter n=1 Tax=Robbsia andropogonis TaxID=28092 RepID=UPI0004669DB9|nr:MFS transporter [Robbsia andropogonis]MCP1118265.1 MFS transporter [Robbsia andropogonis]MCP1127454.1 MFS transporter [Robbsia andropogonis]